MDLPALVYPTSATDSTSARRRARRCTSRCLCTRRELVLEHFDALAEQPPVGFQLCLAGSAQANAALLPLQVGPAAHQARGQMLELGQLDLQFALVAAGALREDVEDQTDAVDNAAVQRLLQVALLRRRQLVVERHNRGPLFAHRGGELGDLAATGEGGRVRALALALHDRDDLQAGACRKLLQLGQPRLVIGSPKSRLTSTARSPPLGRSNIEAISTAPARREMWKLTGCCACAHSPESEE